MLKLAKEFNFSNTAAIIKLTTKEPTVDGQKLVVTGWGAVREGGGIALDLQVVTVHLVKRASCENFYNGGDIQIHKSMICAGVLEGGKDACQGDSGGPLVLQKNGSYEQVGVVSWGYGCARPNYPGVYSNVDYLREWIEEVLLL